MNELFSCHGFHLMIGVRVQIPQSSCGSAINPPLAPVGPASGIFATKGHSQIQNHWILSSQTKGILFTPRSTAVHFLESGFTAIKI